MNTRVPVAHASWTLIVFQSGFAEGLEADLISSDTGNNAANDANAPVAMSDKSDLEPETVGLAPRFEDSDDEDDDEEPVPESQITLQLPDTPKRPRPSRPSSWASSDQGVANDEDGTEGRNVKAKLSHPSSPRAEASIIEEILVPSSEPVVPGPKKVKVIVKDVAYSTYRAVLNYVSPPMVKL